MIGNRHRSAESHKRPSWEAAIRSAMQIQIRQGLTRHYEVPQGLPHEMLVLLLQLNEQPEDES
jgi:hypothetical protein